MRIRPLDSSANVLKLVDVEDATTSPFEADANVDLVGEFDIGHLPFVNRKPLAIHVQHECSTINVAIALQVEVLPEICIYHEGNIECPSVSRTVF